MTSWRDVRSSDLFAEFELEWEAGLLLTLQSHFFEIERHQRSDLYRLIERAKARLDQYRASGGDPRPDDDLLAGC